VLRSGYRFLIIAPPFERVAGMQNPKRELSSVALPRTLVYATAMTCGVLAALALQIYLNRAGYDLVGLWGNPLSPRALQLRTTGPWWATAGLAFLVSGAVATMLSRLPLPWRRFRLLRWIAGAVVVYLLAYVGHSAAVPEGVAAGTSVAASLGAVALAALMSLCGAYFTVHR
jgi:hypothetical protein